jgi:hypothetical protein
MSNGNAFRRERGIYHPGMSGYYTCQSCRPAKQIYASRKAAKLAARQQPDKGRMTAYRCPGEEGWHVGHLPKGISNGSYDRDSLRRWQAS